MSGGTRSNGYEPPSGRVFEQVGRSATVTADLNVGIVWDAENRLTEVRQGPTTVAAFVYDGLGRRQQKTAGGAAHTYISDQRSLVEERVSSGQTLRYVEGPEIDQHLAMQDGTAVTYYVADHLGSVLQETNSSGVVTLARKYDPWGNMLAGASAAGWAFTGREWDPETGLYYYRARSLASGLGRFISEDPLPVQVLHDLGGDSNLYTYAASNPAGFTDPQGLSRTSCPSSPPSANRPTRPRSNCKVWYCRFMILSKAGYRCGIIKFLPNCGRVTVPVRCIFWMHVPECPKMLDPIPVPPGTPPEAEPSPMTIELPCDPCGA